MDQVNATWHDITEVARKVPGVDWTIDNVISGLLQLVNEMTQDTVWTEAIYKEYRLRGHAVEGAPDIHELDLEHIDGALVGLKTKYNALAAVEGTATGFAGAAGIVPDIAALVSITLRAAGEYAAYCGFDIAKVEERLYALHILDVVSRPSDVTKDLAFAPVVRVTKRYARQQSLEAIQQMAIARTIKAIGSRLTRIKMTQIVPVTSAVIGGSFNAMYTNKVCDAAFNLYRERFLLEKYGPDVLFGPKGNGPEETEG
jgi:hypothetical protein